MYLFGMASSRKIQLHPWSVIYMGPPDELSDLDWIVPIDVIKMVPTPTKPLVTVLNPRSQKTMLLYLLWLTWDNHRHNNNILLLVTVFITIMNISTSGSNLSTLSNTTKLQLPVVQLLVRKWIQIWKLQYNHPSLPTAPTASSIPLYQYTASQ